MPCCASDVVGGHGDTVGDWRRRCEVARLGQRVLAGEGEANEPAWRRYLLRVGDFQGRLFLSLLYFSLIPPFPLVARLGRDALQMRAPPEDRSTYWHGTGAREDVDDLRRPY